MNEQEFLDFWKAIEWPEIKTVYLRLYYDNLGRPLFYSHDDLPGKYIEVTPEQFALQDQSVRVIDRKILSRRTSRMTKLVPAMSGTLCHTQDVTVVVSGWPGQYWKKTENVVETN